jgi:hypothetical protein
MKKTKFMTVPWKPYNKNECGKRGTCNSEIVKDYTYIGSILTNKIELRPEIAKRITNAKWAYYALLRVLQSQRTLRAEKNKNL